MLNLEQLRKSDPVNFYSNWRRLDPKGFGLARIRVSYEDTCAIVKKCAQGKLSPKEMSHAKKNHFELIKRMSSLCNLQKADVRAYYVK